MLLRSLIAMLLVAVCATAGADDRPVVLVWGDSLSAAYGVPLSSGWVALLQDRLEDEGYPHRVVNGSVSGETTAGGLARLPAALQRNRPELLLIELGANDGLRGLSLKRMRSNLAAMIEIAAGEGAGTVLFEMRIPTNYGPAYASAFADSFGRVSEDKGVPLVPFFLASFALNESMFQSDGIHPQAQAQPLMLDAVWAVVEPLLGAK